MPKLPSQPLEFLRDLERDVRFAPREARLKQVERAAALCAILAPDGAYPHAWVVERITGYTSEGAGGPACSGSELLRGLATFTERQSDGAEMTLHEVSGPILAAELLARWGVSVATLRRLRAQGLAGLRVRDDRGQRLVVFTGASVRAFEVNYSELQSRPAPATRVTKEEAARWVRLAARYRRRLQWSLTRAANRLAEREGRSVETVRRVLLAARENPAAPMLGPRKREALRRASRLGVDVGFLARRTGRSRGAVRRAISLARADFLRSLLEDASLRGHVGPTFQLLGAEGAILTPVPVKVFGTPAMPVPLRRVLDAAQAMRPHPPAHEHQRAVAHHYLRWRARTSVEKLHRLLPSAGAVDQAETDLRWASRIKAAMVWSDLPVIARTIEARLARPLADLPPDEAAWLLERCLIAGSAAVDAFDPFKGGRLAGPLGLATDRVALAWKRAHETGLSGARRAQVVLGESHRLRDWALVLDPWQGRLEPPFWVRLALAQGWSGAAEEAGFLRLRFGLGGGGGPEAPVRGEEAWPHTLRQLSERYNVASTRIGAMEARCLAGALGAMRAAARIGT